MVQNTHKMFTVVVPYLLTVLGTLSTILLGTLLWIGSEKNNKLIEIDKSVHKIEVDIAAIQSNRFTKEEGKFLTDRVRTLETEMAALPTEYPPALFMQQFDAVKKTVDSIDTKTDVITLSVGRLETQVNSLHAGGGG